MRYGIVGDIHGNLEALEVALGILEEQGVDQLLCLGDVVGYNADPVRCVEIIRDKCAAVIKGNHERMVLGLDRHVVRQETADAITWTRDQLSDADITWLRNLPEALDVGEHVRIVHGSPRDCDEYILSGEIMRDNLLYLEQQMPGVRVCFFGHSHYPMVVNMRELHMRFAETRRVRVVPDLVTLINPGSVGQPRDGCPLSAFALYDDETSEVTLFRAPYDITKAQAKIRAAGLGEKLALRLAKGY